MEKVEVPKKKYKKNNGGVVCCVVGCHSSYPRDRLRFFNFSVKNLEQRELWIKAVNRINADGSEWLPKYHTRFSKLDYCTLKYFF